MCRIRDDETERQVLQDVREQKRGDNMSLREDVELYTKLSGEDGSKETIGTIGAYLRGYSQGKEDAEPHWIPCSERLPEIKQHVLLSCYGRVIYGRMISEDGNSGYPVFEICDSVGEKRPIVLETTVHSKFTTSRIIAWMPLPEPYKGGEQDG